MFYLTDTNCVYRHQLRTVHDMTGYHTKQMAKIQNRKNGGEVWCGSCGSKPVEGGGGESLSARFNYSISPYGKEPACPTVFRGGTVCLQGLRCSGG